MILTGVIVCENEGGFNAIPMDTTKHESEGGLIDVM